MMGAGALCIVCPRRKHGLPFGLCKKSEANEEFEGLYLRQQDSVVLESSHRDTRWRFALCIALWRGVSIKRRDTSGVRFELFCFIQTFRYWRRDVVFSSLQSIQHGARRRWAMALCVKATIVTSLEGFLNRLLLVWFPLSWLKNNISYNNISIYVVTIPNKM